MLHLVLGSFFPWDLKLHSVKCKNLSCIAGEIFTYVYTPATTVWIKIITFLIHMTVSLYFSANCPQSYHHLNNHPGLGQKASSSSAQPLMYSANLYKFLFLCVCQEIDWMTFLDSFSFTIPGEIWKVKLFSPKGS
jgi:hypothetical protein